MSESIGTFSETAKALSRNPLGIVALFIVLVYGMAALVLGAAVGGLGAFERVLLVIFLVSFPPSVMWVFRDLVINHTFKLYGPGDFKDEKAYIDVVTALNAASSKPTTTHGLTAPFFDPAKLRSVAQVAITTARSAPQPLGVLWVDDNPQNNVHEREALEAAGFPVQIARTTEEALHLAASHSYHTVISDMKRPEGDEAGFDLLQKLRAAGDTTNFIIYSGAQALPLAETARLRGAFGCTNDPGRLLTLVASSSLL